MKKDEKQYLVWSIQHNSWWRPAEFGYTSKIKEAGTYTEKEAKDICIKANVVKIEEIMIPVSSLHQDYNEMSWN